VLGLGDHAAADDADSDRIRTVHERGLYAASYGRVPHGRRRVRMMVSSAGEGDGAVPA
jgi:hypothetical protein